MRLIDADDLVQKYGAGLTPKMLHRIQQAPTVDAVHVVRCNVCVNYNTYNCSSGFGWCENLGIGVHDSFFCKVGEREEGDE